MTDYDKNKGFTINQLLHIVKIASLVFSAIAFFQYYFKDKQLYYLLTNDGFIFFAVLIILLIVYFAWNFIQTKMQSNHFIITWVQPFIFFFISTLAIMLTGDYASDYKFLFLFVIIASCIESGTKIGMFIAGLSSSFILAIDIILAPAGSTNSYFESDIVLSCAFIIIAWTIGLYVRTEKEHIDMLKGLVHFDGLTGLYNHRYFYDMIEEYLSDSEERNQPLALLFMDLDYFKYYNDLNGHQEGDEVLKTVASLIKNSVRATDIVSRYGGEEFAVILPDTDQEEALRIAERVRLAVWTEEFIGEEYLPTERLTISIGVSVYPDNANNEIDLIKYADEALYRAKFLSRNTVQPYYSILDDLQKDVSENDLEIIASIRTLIAVINAKDRYTYSHIERVVSYCEMMADRLNLDAETKKTFIYAAYMHDLGKINIPEEILIKTGKLTDSEWEILKNHSKNGAEIINSVSVLADVVPIIMQHHERYDGTGYPMNLKGEEITYLARVLTVADSFDAMTSHRPYQTMKTHAEAFDELAKCSGSQFDPDIVRIFIDTVKTQMNH